MFNGVVCGGLPISFNSNFWQFHEAITFAVHAWQALKFLAYNVVHLCAAQGVVVEGGEFYNVVGNLHRLRGAAHDQGIPLYFFFDKIPIYCSVFPI